jgi:hypothetical protein
MVRTRREETAVKDLRVSRERLNEAQREEERAREALVKYQKFVETETERRWKALLGSNTTSRGLEEFWKGLSDLKYRETEFEAKIFEAVKVVQDRQNDVENCKVELQNRRKAREKLELHQKAWQAQQNAELERLENLEMEEFTSVSIDQA